MPQILITQHFSRNKGNVSLLYALYEALKKKIPRSRIIVSSFDPDDTRTMFGYDTCPWPFQTRLIMDATGIHRVLNALFELYYIIAYFVTAWFIRWRIVNQRKLKGRFETLRTICESDLIISPGGHLFTNLNSFVAVFAHFYPLLLATIVQRRYVIIAQTIGPFFGPFRLPSIWIACYLIRHAVYVSVRDANTLVTLKNLGIDVQDVHKTNELVFLFPESSAQKGHIKGLTDPVKQTLGITFHHIYYQKFMSKDTYIGHMKKFIDGVIERYGFNVVFISMESLTTGKGDIPLLKEIREKLASPQQATISNVSMDPRELLGLFASLDFLVATKTHSVVYGLRMGIPTLAIAYAQKTNDFMSEFGQAEFSVPLGQFDPDDALTRFSRLVAEKNNIIIQLNGSLKKIQDQAQENIDAIAGILQD